MLFQLGRDLLRQRDPAVVHHAQDAHDLDLRIEVGVHFPDGSHQVAQTLQRVVLALHRDDHALGSAQAVQGQQRQ